MTSPATHRWLPVAAIGITLVFWASAFVAIRDLGEEVTPGALSLGRLLVASLALGVFLLFRPRRWPSRADWCAMIEWKGIGARWGVSKMRCAPPRGRNTTSPCSTCTGAAPCIWIWQDRPAKIYSGARLRLSMAIANPAPSRAWK